MTNIISDSMQYASAAPITDIVIHEPVPWSAALLLILWFTSALAIFTGIIIGIIKKRKGQNTASLSTICLVISTGILFWGGGTILWHTATALSDVISNSTQLHLTMPFVVLGISSSLYCLGFNSILAGLGFITSIALREKTTKPQQGGPGYSAQGALSPDP